jgi:hypothetical protein
MDTPPQLGVQICLHLLSEPDLVNPREFTFAVVERLGCPLFHARVLPVDVNERTFYILG